MHFVCTYEDRFMSDMIKKNDSNFFQFQLTVNEAAKKVETQAAVTKIRIKITTTDKKEFYKPVQLKLSIHACFELGKINTKIIIFFIHLLTLMNLK